jgi:hypothetical protein
MTTANFMQVIKPYEVGEELEFNVNGDGKWKTVHVTGVGQELVEFKNTWRRECVGVTTDSYNTLSKTSRLLRRPHPTVPYTLTASTMNAQWVQYGSQSESPKLVIDAGDEVYYRGAMNKKYLVLQKIVEKDVAYVVLRSDEMPVVVREKNVTLAPSIKVVSFNVDRNDFKVWGKHTSSCPICMKAHEIATQRFNETLL